MGGCVYLCCQCRTDGLLLRRRFRPVAGCHPIHSMKSAAALQNLSDDGHHLKCLWKLVKTVRVVELPDVEYNVVDDVSSREKLVIAQNGNRNGKRLKAFYSFSRS